MAKLDRGATFRTGKVITGPKHVKGGRAKWVPPINKTALRAEYKNRESLNFLVEGKDKFGNPVSVHISHPKFWNTTHVLNGEIKKWCDVKEDYIIIGKILNRMVFKYVEDRHA